MTYRVELIPLAEEQVATLPQDGLMAYLSVHVAIAVEPWAGRPLGNDPDANMRQRTFGQHSEGLAIYVVLDHDERAVVVQVLWAG